MIINSEQIEDLRRRKEIFRRYTKNLSPSDKMRELQNLQWRYYNLLKARADGGGRPMPEKWQKWRNAQPSD